MAGSMLTGARHPAKCGSALWDGQEIFEQGASTPEGATMKVACSIEIG